VTCVNPFLIPVLAKRNSKNTNQLTHSKVVSSVYNRHKQNYWWVSARSTRYSVTLLIPTVPTCKCVNQFDDSKRKNKAKERKN